eukprot:TRINITY_DN1774_c0_g1_i2.p1 TRINITY_DN1774_c0_g1~~TRINITY_DN1774_c0_g1_i2.p1  ORF type:complete len:4665 (+),score=549.86 TRINITY_DN1774_c0_g1_i2:454-13995(+)
MWKGLSEGLANVGKTIEKAVNDIGDAVFGHIIGPFVKLFEMIFDKLVEFDRCLPSHYKIDGMIKLMVGKDFGQVLDTFFNLFLVDPVKSGIEWLEYQTVEGWKALQRTIDAGPNNATGRDWIIDALDYSWDMMKNLFSRRGYEACGCFQSILLEPFYFGMRGIIADFVEFVVNPIQASFMLLMDAFYDWLGTALSYVMDSVGANATELETFMSGAVSRACSVVLDTSRGKVEDAFGKISSGTIGREEVKELRAELTGSLPGYMAGTVIAETIGYYLGLFFDWSGEHLIDPGLQFVVDSVGSTFSFILHWINGWLGLVPEVGAAISSIITTCLQASQEWMSNAAVMLGKISIRASLEDVRKEVVNMIRDAMEAVTDSKNGLITWVKPLVDNIKRMGLQMMPSVDIEMQKCQVTRKAIADILAMATFGEDNETDLEPSCSSPECVLSTNDKLMARATRRRRRSNAVKYVAKLPNCIDSSTCIDVSIDGGASSLVGRYCPIARDGLGEHVYLLRGATIEDTVYFSKQHEPGQECKQGDWSFRKGDAARDLLDPLGGFVELNGPVIACWKTTQTVEGNSFKVGLHDRVFGVVADEGEFFSIIDASKSTDSESVIAYFALSPSSCVFNLTDDASDEFAHSVFVFDDPSTLDIEADYFVHPCDCFPESWGRQRPVDDEAADAVPAGSNNKFFSGRVLVLEGGAMCSSDALLHSEAVADVDACEALCAKTLGCEFFFHGGRDGNTICNLYEACTDFVFEIGLLGSLYTKARFEKRVCRVANAHACWAETKRRQYLTQGFTVGHTCWMEELARLCDYYIILGLHLEQCMRCEYRYVDSDPSWEEKKLLPKTFANGETLGVSCWAERYAGRDGSGAFAPDGVAIKCIDGSWVSSSGEAGLGGFECVQCVQVASFGYKDLLQDRKQELYFSNFFRVRVSVDFGRDKPQCLYKDLRTMERDPVLAKLAQDGLEATSSRPTATFQECEESADVDVDDIVKGPEGNIESVPPAGCTCVLKGNSKPCSEQDPVESTGDHGWCYTDDRCPSTAGVIKGRKYVYCNRQPAGDYVDCLGRVRYETSTGEYSEWVEPSNEDDTVAFNCNSANFNGKFKELENTTSGTKTFCRCRRKQTGSVFYLERASAASVASSRRLRSESNQFTEGDRCFGSPVETSTNQQPSNRIGFHPCASGPSAAGQHFTTSSLGHSFRRMLSEDYSFDSQMVSGKDAESGFLHLDAKHKLTTPDILKKEPHMADCGIYEDRSEKKYPKLSRKKVIRSPPVPQESNHVVLSSVKFALQNNDILKSEFRCDFTMLSRNSLDVYEVRTKDMKRKFNEEDENNNTIQATIKSNSLKRVHFGLLPPAKCSGSALLRTLRYSFEDKSNDKAVFFQMKTYYTCRNVSGAGACYDFLSPRFTLDQEKLVSSLDDLGAECKEGHGLQFIAFQGSDEGMTMSVRMKCCQLGAVPFSIKPLAMSESSLDPREGVYCPSKSTSSGRYSYSKVGNFGLMGLKSGIIEYDSWQGQWCLGGATSTCIDYPRQWSDTGYRSCADYEANKLCTSSGKAGPGWNKSWGDISDYGTRGFHATRACCACGGGRQTKLCYSRQRVVSPWHIVANGDTSDEVDPLEIVELTNFDGEFGPLAAAMAAEAGDEAKYPAIVHFSSPEPKHADECKDENLYVPENMAEFGEKQDETSWKKHPCSGVAGYDGGEWIHEWGSSYISSEDSKRKGGVVAGTLEECREREENRDDGAAEYEELLLEQSAASTTRAGYASVIAHISPALIATALGVGVRKRFGEIISSLATLGDTLVSSELEYNIAKKYRDTQLVDYKDCKSAVVPFNRLFCDVYCIRDAIVAGNDAVLTGLTRATRTVNENFVKLIDHSSEKISSKIDALTAKVASSGGTRTSAQRLLTQDPAQVQGRIMALFEELHQMSNEPFTLASEASATRASQDFISHVGQLFASDGDGNSTYKLHRAEKLAQTMHAKVASAWRASRASLPTPSASSAAHISEQGKLLLSRLRRRTAILNHWRLAHKLGRTLRQQTVMRNGVSDEILKHSVVLEFDEALWTARAQLDNYLDAAEEQNDAYILALKSLQDYRNCRIDFNTLTEAYNAADSKGKIALDLLEKTWREMLHTVSMHPVLADAHVFEVLVQEDVDSVSVPAWHAALMQQTRSNVTDISMSVQTPEREPACLFATEMGAAGLRKAIVRQLSNGAAGKAFEQIQDVFFILNVLRERRASEGLTSSSWELDELRSALENFGEVTRVTLQDLSASVHKLQAKLVPSACSQEHTASAIALSAEFHHMDVNAFSQEDIAHAIVEKMKQAQQTRLEIADLWARKQRIEMRQTQTTANIKGKPESFIQLASTVQAVSPHELPGLRSQAVGVLEAIDARKASLFGQCSLSDHQHAKVGGALQKVPRKQAPPSLKYKCASGGTACRCSNEEIVLEQLWTHDNIVLQSCCPLSSRACAGCARYANGTCVQCTGGFVMLDDGTCTACMDVVGWMDEKKNTCDAYGGSSSSIAAQKELTCTSHDTSKAHKGLAAADACCACGGGVSRAIPFVYNVKAGVLGNRVSGFPVPRTASRYSLERDCPLAKYGLAFDGTSGVLSGVATSEEAFELLCLVTAHQKDGNEARSHLKLMVKAAFNYPSSLVFGNGFEPAYSPNLQPGLPALNFKMSCAPSLAWLEIDETTGTLTAVEPDTRASKSNGFVSGLDNVSLANGGTCFVSAKTNGGERLGGSLFVVSWPKYLDRLEYETSDLSLVVGGTVPEIHLISSDTSDWDQGKLSPGYYSVLCNAFDNDFSYDPSIGVAYVNGKEAFSFDSSTAAFGGVVSTDFFQGLQATTATRGGVPLVRETFKMPCMVTGHASDKWGSRRVVTSGTIAIKVHDSSCWTEGRRSTGVFNEDLAVAVTNVHSELDCRAECGKHNDCSHYAWQDTNKSCKISTARSLPRRSASGQAVPKVALERRRAPEHSVRRSVPSSVELAYAAHVAQRRETLEEISRDEVNHRRADFSGSTLFHFASFQRPRHAELLQTVVKRYKGKRPAAQPATARKPAALDRLVVNKTSKEKSGSLLEIARARGVVVANMTAGGDWLSAVFGAVEDFIGAVDQLRAQFDGVTHCMNTLPDERYHIESIFNFAIERIMDPIKLITEGVDIYVKPFIEGTLNWVKSAGSGDRADKKQQEMEEEAVGDKEGAHASESVDDHWLLKMVDETYESLLDLSSQEGMGPTKCLVVHIVKPAFDAMKAEMVKMMESFLWPIIEIFNGLMDEVLSVMGETLISIVKDLPLMKRLREAAKEEASKSCVSAMQDVAVRSDVFMDQLRHAMLYPNLTEDLSQFIDDLQVPINEMPVYSAIIDRGMEELFAYIKSDWVGPILNGILRVFQKLNGFVTHVADGIAGLIPEVGALIAALVTSGATQAISYLKDEVFKEGMDWIDTLLNTLRELVSGSAKAILGFAGKAGSRIGAESPGGPIVIVIKKLAESANPDAYKILRRCNGNRKNQAGLLRLAAIAKGVFIPTPVPTPPTSAPTLPEPAQPAVAGGCKVTPGLLGEQRCVAPATQLTFAECKALPGNWVGELAKGFSPVSSEEDKPSGCYNIGRYIYYNKHATGGMDSDARPVCKTCPTPQPTPVPTPAPTTCGPPLEHNEASIFLWLNTSSRASALQHGGQDCFDQCGGKGGMCDYCGAGNACCHGGSAQDPEACDLAVNAPSDKHACVKVAKEIICPSNQVMTSLASKYEDTTNDRSWKFGCSSVIGATLIDCSWSEKFSDLSTDFVLQPATGGPRFVAGVRSYYSHSLRDRTVQFRYCAVAGAGVNIKVESDWKNGYRRDLNVVLPTHQFLFGLESQRDRSFNENKDRIYKPLILEACFKAPTTMMSALFGGGLCATLDVEDQSLGLKMDKCVGTQNQKFYFDGGLMKTLTNSDFCLDYDSGLGKLKMYECNGHENQQWFFDDAGRLKTKRDEAKCLDVDRRTLSKLILSPCTEDPGQRWSLGEVPATPAPTAPSVYMEASLGSLSNECPDGFAVISKASDCKQYAKNIEAKYEAACQSSEVGSHEPWCADRPSGCWRDSTSAFVAFKGAGTDLAHSATSPICEKADRIFVIAEVGADSYACPGGSVSVASMDTCSQYALKTGAKFDGSCSSYVLPEQAEFCANRPRRCWQDAATKTVYFKGAGDDVGSVSATPICMKAPASELISFFDNKCVDYAFDDQNGNAYMFDCHGGKNQQWYFDGMQLKTMWDSEKCMTYDLNTNNVHLKTCQNGDYQKWYLQGQQLKTYADDKCLDYDPGSGNLYMSACHSENNQQWRFKSMRDPEAYAKAAITDVEIIEAIAGDRAYAQCGVGQRLLSGGCESLEHPHKFQESMPDGDSVWKCAGHGGNKKSWAICSGVHLPVIKSKDGGDWDEVECDIGQKVIGGGCAAKTHPHFFSQSSPKGDNKWLCGGGGGDKKVWAICSSTIKPMIKKMDGGDWVTASCDDGYRAIGGGCSVTSSPFMMSKNGPKGNNAWECGGNGGQKTAWVICKMVDTASGNVTV